ncbi:MAG: efflux transporter outer membrane subunit [Proteobacteria bacterium]|nr:efflux transporter outer membrane subunit [Pseudomonadota bacterium]MBU1419125.1 efflux transporter outer membrane subunit [Pseudomonadota bacterium]MBU1455981.1 efflux transporter outer membrane subunit [Pseudomonadota bacterium]
MTQLCCGRNTSTKRYLWHNVGIVLSALSLLSLAGCAAVGPDYVPRETTAPPTWHTELRQGVSGETPDPKQLADWWTTLEDPILTELIIQAVTNNLDLKQAMAKVREARARRGISQAGQFPTLDANGSASRSQGSKNSGGGTTRSSYVVGFDAGWEVDIFGGVRRAVEAAEADLAASHEDLRDVLVTLAAEVALNYLDTRTLQTRLAVAEGNLVIQQQTFDLTQSRCQAGLSDGLVLQQARYNLENTRAQIPGLRSSMEEAKNRLAVLTGRTPGGMHELLAERRPIPVAPPTVAVGVPAETLRQRPDIRRAERNLAAQTARIGVATADLYPKFRLAGSIGLESLKSADLFDSASETWRIGPSVSWNVFDAGAVRQNIEVQSAIQEQYLLAYEAAVLAALEEVENALTVYAEEQLRRESLLAAVDAASQAEALARNQYDAGMVDFTSVLDSQRSLLSFEDQLAVSDGTVTSNLIRLYKALGGGWISSAAPQFSEKDERQ